jgi:hypothetical protein
LNVGAWLVRREHQLPLVLGFSDGIFNALALSARQIIDGTGRSDAGTVLKVPTFAFVSGAFVFFVARYAEARRELVRVEQELNIVERGTLRATRLGRQATRDATGQALIASTMAFAGALLPVGLAALFPSQPWLVFGLVFVVLGCMGAVLARATAGSTLAWIGGVLGGAVILTAVGAQLALV